MSPKIQMQYIEPNIRLLVTKGKDGGKVYESNCYPFVIGRDESADFILRHDCNISRKHAKLFVDEDNNIWIQDLKSTNGCFVNNIKIKHKKQLKSGNTIILGNTWLKFIIFKPRKAEKTKAKKIDPIEEMSTSYIETKKLEAILILDQYNSSRIANRYGDDVAMKMTEILTKISLPAFNKFNSQFCKGTGDGFLVTFKNAGDCLCVAQEILRKIKLRNKRSCDKEKIHIRISLNYGQCTIEPNEDRHGNAVNVAFRVEGLKYKDIKKNRECISSKEFPEKDRIFATSDFLEQLEERRKKRFFCIGNFKLKGIGGNHPVYKYE